MRAKKYFGFDLSKLFRSKAADGDSAASIVPQTAPEEEEVVPHLSVETLSRRLVQLAEDFAGGKGDGGKTARTMAALVAGGAECNAQNDKGETPLMIVSARTDAGPAIEQLIVSGATVDAVLNNGETPFLRAAASGCPDNMRILLDHGADAKAIRTDKPRYQLGDASIGGGSRDVFDCVIINRIDEPAEKLERRAASLKLLMDRGYEPSKSDKFSVFCNRPHLRFLFPGVDEARALDKAADSEDADAVQALLAKGAKPDGAADFGADPAMIVAIRKGNTAIIDMLLKAGADINLRSPQTNATPLSCALNHGNRAVLEHLLERGADPVAQGLTDEKSILFQAHDKPELVQVILAAAEKAKTVLLKPVAVGRPLKFRQP